MSAPLSPNISPKISVLLATAQWTPDPDIAWAELEIIAPGGGGGGHQGIAASTANRAYCSACGSGGAYLKFLISRAQLKTESWPILVTIGQPGAGGGIDGSTGGTGGAVLIGNAGSIAQVPGGNGGLGTASLGSMAVIHSAGSAAATSLPTISKGSLIYSEKGGGGGETLGSSGGSTTTSTKTFWVSNGGPPGGRTPRPPTFYSGVGSALGNAVVGGTYQSSQSADPFGPFFGFGGGGIAMVTTVAASVGPVAAPPGGPGRVVITEYF